MKKVGLMLSVWCRHWGMASEAARQDLATEKNFVVIGV